MPKDPKNPARGIGISVSYDKVKDMPYVKVGKVTRLLMELRRRKNAKIKRDEPGRKD